MATNRPLPCDICGLPFAHTKADNGVVEFDFPRSGRAPSPLCAEQRHDSRCRYHVARRRANAVIGLSPAWTNAGDVLWATIVMRGGELTLSEARRVTPLTWSKKARRLIGEALQPLPSDERHSVRGIGAVEPGIVDIREHGVRARRLAVMHIHALIWGIPRARLKKLLDAVVQRTATVVQPVKVKHAPTPAGALGYAFKHADDHRAQVREKGRKAFKRRLEPDETRILRRWSGFPAADAAVMVGLRRNASGRIAPYGTPAGATGPRKMAPRDSCRTRVRSRRRGGSGQAEAAGDKH